MVTLPDARTPPGMRIYAIGDVHGRYDLLCQVHDWIEADLARIQPQDWRVVHLGDYIDRGPQPRQVLEFLIRRSADPRIICLKGNHDHYLTDFADDMDTAYLERWLTYGGAETFEGYGIDPGFATLPVHDPMRPEIHAELLEAVPPEHLDFLDALDLSLHLGDYFFAHAGVQPGVALDRQQDWKLMWMREPFLSSDEDLGAVVVHGHTISDVPVVRRNRIGIDTGAFRTDRLTCLVLEGARFGILNERSVKQLSIES